MDDPPISLRGIGWSRLLRREITSSSKLRRQPTELRLTLQTPTTKEIATSSLSSSPLTFIPASPTAATPPTMSSNEKSPIVLGLQRDKATTIWRRGQTPDAWKKVRDRRTKVTDFGGGRLMVFSGRSQKMKATTAQIPSDSRGVKERQQHRAQEKEGPNKTLGYSYDQRHLVVSGPKVRTKMIEMTSTRPSNDNRPSTRSMTRSDRSMSPPESIQSSDGSGSVYTPSQGRNSEDDGNKSREASMTRLGRSLNRRGSMHNSDRPESIYAPSHVSEVKDDGIRSREASRSRSERSSSRPVSVQSSDGAGSVFAPSQVSEVEEDVIRSRELPEARSQQSVSRPRSLQTSARSRTVHATSRVGEADDDEIDNASLASIPSDAFRSTPSNAGSRASSSGRHDAVEAYAEYLDQRQRSESIISLRRIHLERAADMQLHHENAAEAGLSSFIAPSGRAQSHGSQRSGSYHSTGRSESGSEMSLSHDSHGYSSYHSSGRSESGSNRRQSQGSRRSRSYLSEERSESGSELSHSHGSSHRSGSRHSRGSNEDADGETEDDL